MVNYVYKALCKYFAHLCHTGYMSQDAVDKLLILTFIQRMVDCDFRGYLNEEDYNKINKALYKLYGTSCLLSYPEYFNNQYNRIMYTCSISELASRVSRLEKSGASGGDLPIDLQDKEIVTPGDYIKNVQDTTLFD